MLSLRSIATLRLFHIMLQWLMTICMEFMEDTANINSGVSLVHNMGKREVPQKMILLLSRDKLSITSSEVLGCFSVA